MQTFCKDERLSEKIIINALFVNGKSFRQDPFKVIWLEIKSEESLQSRLLISVPKKRIKKAVDRNLVKRRIRESYRKNKLILIEFLKQKQIKCVFAIIYNSSEIASYNEIEKKIIQILQRFQTEYEKSIK
jgi:ribonuclease P protein component